MAAKPSPTKDESIGQLFDLPQGLQIPPEMYPASGAGPPGFRPGAPPEPPVDPRAGSLQDLFQQWLARQKDTLNPPPRFPFQEDRWAAARNPYGRVQADQLPDERTALDRAGQWSAENVGINPLVLLGYGPDGPRNLDPAWYAEHPQEPADYSLNEPKMAIRAYTGKLDSQQPASHTYYKGGR